MGISYLFGFITLIIFIILNSYVMKKYTQANNEVMKKNDYRMKLTSKTLKSLKLLKLYACEDQFLERIKERRYQEISKLRESFKYFNLANTCV